MSEEKSIHSGHRQRQKTKFLRSGLDNFTDVEVLELLLYYAVPRQDTNPMAHRLLDVFGGISAVFDASVEDLMKRGGLSENTAILIKLVPEAARHYQIERAKVGKILDTTQKYGDYLVPYFFGATDEVVYLLGLDAKCKVLSCVRLFTGSVNFATLSIRRIVECAINMKATSVILAHNHPSGIAVPSKEDIRTTSSVSHALSLVGVTLRDHIVVADGDFVSLADSGLIGEG